MKAEERRELKTNTLVATLERAGRAIKEGPSRRTVVILGILVLVCWFICAKIEPAIRRQLTQVFSDFGRLPKTEPLSRLPGPHPGLRRAAPVRARVNFTGR